MVTNSLLSPRKTSSSLSVSKRSFFNVHLRIEKGKNPVLSILVCDGFFSLPHFLPQFAFFYRAIPDQIGSRADALSALYRAGSIGRNSRKYIYTCHGRTYRYGATSVNMLAEVMSVPELNKRTFGCGGSAGSENRSPKLGSVRQDRRGVDPKWIATVRNY